MKYNAQFKQNAIDAMQNIDKEHRVRIYKWIQKNLDGSEMPTSHGKPLTGNYKGFWRYRVGSYRIIVEIVEHTNTVFIVAVGHRSNIYKKTNLTQKE
jgi:mRNA interferase RelE/StbE